MCGVSILQTTEEQFFSNKTTTPAFQEFLELIGQRVHLQGFDGFRGGLDTIKGQTGAESIRTDYEGREIMFHVSTLLPYTDGDSQQVRKLASPKTSATFPSLIWWMFTSAVWNSISVMDQSFSVVITHFSVINHQTVKAP